MRELPPVPRPRPARAGLEPTLRVLIAHYLEMPGLSLTASQARRLCGLADLDVAAADLVLGQLVQEGFLAKTPDGRYRRAA